jgi:hypothetical protein
MAQNNPKITKNCQNKCQKSPKIANWPAISAASAVKIVLPQLCGSQAEFATEVSLP